VWTSILYLSSAPTDSTADAALAGNVSLTVETPQARRAPTPASTSSERDRKVEKEIKSCLGDPRLLSLSLSLSQCQCSRRRRVRGLSLFAHWRSGGGRGKGTREASGQSPAFGAHDRTPRRRLKRRGSRLRFLLQLHLFLLVAKVHAPLLLLPPSPFPPAPLSRGLLRYLSLQVFGEQICLAQRPTASVFFIPALLLHVCFPTFWFLCRFFAAVWAPKFAPLRSIAIALELLAVPSATTEGAIQRVLIVSPKFCWGNRMGNCRFFFFMSHSHCRDFATRRISLGSS
jgi:hypothetical protein